MHLQRSVALSSLWHAFGYTATDSKFDVLDLIDPLIGTGPGGHVFPGASLPYSMAKAVADVDKEIQGGFATNDGHITGFSHMHDSGTGGGASLGNFPLFVQTGCPGDELDRCVWTKRDRATERVNGSVVARAGYFAVSLNTSIRAEMTVTNHTALYRFNFHSQSGSKDAEGNKRASALPFSPVILADLTDLSNSRRKGNISVDPQTGRMTGSGTFRPSFGIGNYELHFCADFQGADIRDTGVFQNNRAGTSPKSLKAYDDGQNPILPLGVWARFKAPKSNQILARVGVSFISSSQACSNAEKEIPKYDFEGVRKAAENAWREKLSSITVSAKGVDKSLQRTFWSGIYRTMLSPQDYTGENPLWKSSEPYFDSFYCIWDSFRSTHPLLTLADPHAQALMMRSLIDIYRHEGKLPDCRMSLCKGFTQGGSNADNLLADSYLKGLKDGIDWETAFKAVVSDAEEEPEIWTVGGRGGLASWKKLGYIPTDDFDPNGYGLFTRSISRTVEYSYNDFCIAQMARDMNNIGDAEKYLKRSKNWANVFDADSKSMLNLTGSPDVAALVDSGFSGFLQPRYLNGTFGFQDPALCTGLYNFTSCYLNPGGHETYEAGSWLYTFYIPHDQATLIPKLGGTDEYLRRLDYIHDTPGLLDIGDEQAYLLLFIAHYAGRPGKSSTYAHKYIPSQFNDTIAGIPGNDDSGAMGSFEALTMMGIFPMSGQNVYLITSPFFPEVSIKNRSTGKTATIRNVGFDAGYKNIFIQSAKLNGKPYSKSWVTHEFFRDGGVLELTLGPKENTRWGARKEDLPPSASTDFWKKK